jgi:uncharacterized protein with von Willebrand factor type A (vWA) domain
MDSRKLAQNIETDSFDRELFEELVATSEELKNLLERGSHLLPNFHSFVLDLFASFFKYNVILHPEDEVKRSALICRKLIEKAVSSENYKELRDETILDSFKSAIATAALGGELINWIKSEDGLSQNTLIKEWELEKAAEDYDELKEEAETWKEIEKKKSFDKSPDKSFKEGKKKAQFELRKQEEELKELNEERKKRLDNLDMKLQKLTKSALKQASDRVEEVENELMQWGASIGVPQKKSAGEKLDLAAKLFKNEKLRKLSLMVGSLKQEMLSSRRKVWSKRGSEVYDISLGDDLGRVIPGELAFLKHRALRRDFMRRLLEKKLLQYYLKEEKGRGPLVVCVDGSSSMSGDKEIWAKAVCLTLLEIAKRERRKFIVIVFSGKGAPLRVFGSDMRERWEMKEKEIIELADYFPGGGTDFEDPIDKALEFLRESKFKKGDVVFITDGECDVNSVWLEEFLDVKRRLTFQVFSVLIDLTGRETPESLKKFSDKVTTVSKLTSKDARDIFLNIA